MWCGEEKETPPPVVTFFTPHEFAGMFTIEAFFFFYRTMDAGFYFAFNTKLSAELPKFKNPKPSTDRSNSSGLFFGVLQTGKMHKEIEPCV